MVSLFSGTPNGILLIFILILRESAWMSAQQLKPDGVIQNKNDVSIVCRSKGLTEFQQDEELEDNENIVDCSFGESADGETTPIQGCAKRTAGGISDIRLDNKHDTASLARSYENDLVSISSLSTHDAIKYSNVNCSNHYIFHQNRFYYFHGNHPFSLKNKRELISVETLISLSSSNLRFKILLKEDKFGQFVLELPNGVVVNEGGIITQEGYILEDTQTSLGDQLGLMKETREINTGNPLYFNGRLAVISSPGSENYYHWLLQILPRLIILKESNFGYDRIFINNLRYEWQIKSLQVVLAYLNIPEGKLFVANCGCVIQANRLIVPSVPFIPAKLMPLPNWLKNSLRSIFLRNQNDVGVNSSFNKVYISRKYASSRRISNEEALIGELEGNGFNVVYLERLSPFEQAWVFNQAQIIVGPHGSGFANLIFSKPGCNVIEIDHGMNPPRSFYKRLAFLLSCHYYPYYVDNAEEGDLEEDMIINITEFVQFVRNLGDNQDLNKITK